MVWTSQRMHDFRPTNDIISRKEWQNRGSQLHTVAHSLSCSIVVSRCLSYCSWKEGSTMWMYLYMTQMGSSCQTFSSCMEVQVLSWILRSAMSSGVGFRSIDMKWISQERNGSHWTKRVKNVQRGTECKIHKDALLGNLYVERLI